VSHYEDSLGGLRPRAVDRLRIDFDAFLRFEKNPELPVFIHDFSTSGFRCESAQQLTIGSRVVLRIPKLGQFSATIAWQLGRHAGARFDSPLSLPTMLSIVLAVVQDRAIEADPPVAAAQ
jgi:hypothetical protein